MYTPKEYGGNGGKGGGASTSADLQCTPHGSYTGGRGGGVVVLDVAQDLLLDGEILCNGKSGSGGRAGGGAGGSIFITTGHMTGTGILSVKGGDVTGSTTCLGGGGAGGRIAVHYTNYTYSGTKDAYGGSGHECGGAGTVLFKDLSDNSNSLLVDNNHVCSPLKPNINFNELSDIGRKEYSFHTWVFDHSDCDHNVGCSHSFKEITIQGKAHLAVHRRNIDKHTQYITIYKTSGDKTGTFHVGPHQELTADLPEDSPELQYGLIIYPDGQMQTARNFVVNNITVELEGILTGVENLRIGPGGHVIIK